MKKRLLIIEDEKNLMQVLYDSLSDEFEIIKAFDGEEGIEKFYNAGADLVLLDINLPKVTGWDICKEIRKNSNIPVIIMTARDSDADEYNGLSIGADDYITKPFDTEEFLARVDSLIRRYNMNNKQNKNTEDYRESLYFEGLEILPDEYSVKTDKGMIELLPKEFDVLYFCAINQGRILTKKQIYEAVWNESYAFDDNNIMSVISRIRKKIEEDSSNPKYIQTVKGIGYRFNKGV